MSRVTTHVLDTASGKPAAGVSVRLERSLADESFEEIASGVTDSNGRLGDLMADDALVEVALEEDEEALDNVVVSATRTSRTIAALPTRVETIAGEEIDEKQEQTAE